MQIARDGREYIVTEGYDWFWNQFADKTWEPTTFKIFDKFLDSKHNFIDIGAWIGPTVLYAAPKARQVFAFEPDPVAHHHLVSNLALNHVENVVPYPVAVANDWKGMNFGSKSVYGDSMSSEIWAKQNDAQVPAISLSAIVMDIMPNFIKIDIEGGEKTLFEGASVALAQMHPTIHLSLHTPWFIKNINEYKEAIIRGLSMYSNFYDENLNKIELRDAFDVTRFNSVVATFKEL